MTKTQIEAEIVKQLREGHCPNPACKAQLTKHEIFRSGTALDQVREHNGSLISCAVLFKMVRCGACGAEFRCEQAIPKALYNAAYA